MTNTDFENHLKTIVDNRISVLKDTVLTDEEKKTKLALFDKENDELNQSIDIYFRLVDFQGYSQYTALMETKADITSLDAYALIQNLPDFNTFALSTDLAKKADITQVTTDLAKKLDITQFTTDLAKKADKTQVTTDLAKKADITKVTTDLANKADKTQVTTDLSKKADITQVTTDLAKKANITQLPNMTLYALKSDIVSPNLDIFNPVLNTGLTIASSYCSKIDVVKDNNSLVTISGVFSGASGYTLLFTLPLSFAPKNTSIFPVNLQGVGLVDILITTDGKVSVMNSTNNTKNIFLYISYRIV